jgi:hypothetical protein
VPPPRAPPPPVGRHLDARHGLRLGFTDRTLPGDTR